MKMAKALFDGVDRDGKGKLKLIVVEAQTKSGCTVIFGPVRLSYLNGFKARKNVKRQNALEYSVVALIDKSDEKMLDFVDEQIDHALKTVFGKVIPKFATCLLDGDKETDDDGDSRAPGCMYISTRAEVDQPPLLYKPNSQVPLDSSNATDWVSGDWGYIKLDFFGYDNENRGVSTRWKALQFCAKDDPFGNSVQDPDKVAGEFGDVEGVDKALQGRGDDGDERSSRRRGGRDSDDGGRSEERGRRAGREESRETAEAGGSRRSRFLD
jgi:hypothetical protein